MDLFQDHDTSLTESDKEKLKEYGFTNLINPKPWYNDFRNEWTIYTWKWEGEASMSYQQL